MLGLKFSIAVALTAVSFIAFGQNDDIPDYRTKKESFSKLSDKAIRADLGVFSIGGIEESLNKLPLQKVSPSAYQKDFMRFKGEGIEVTVTTQPFQEKGKKIMKMEEHVIKINNKGYYGSFGVLPETEIKSVLVLIGKDTVAIPPQAYADLYNMNFTYRDKSGTERTANGVFYSKDGSRIYIYLLSRDPKNSYEVTWIIQDKKYFRRVLDYGF